MLGPPSPPLLDGFSPAVYGLVLPETRAMVRRLWEEHPELLYEHAYFDTQDAAHLVFLDEWRRWVSPAVIGLGDFASQYVTNGSSEAIRETVWDLARAARASNRRPQMHVFAGEYEGYAAYARAAGVAVATHPRHEWTNVDYGPDALHRWYISQPSAIDGNSWREFPAFLADTQRHGIEVAVDLAYVGATPTPPSLDLSAPNVTCVLFSLSKVFGVFYHRVGGVLTRSPLLGLEGNKWFKNIFSLYLGTSLIRETPSPATLPTKYRGVQIEACRILGERHSIPLRPSDVLLLASSPAGPYPSAFRRGDGFRWCLTPTLDRVIAAGASREATHA
jgi:hypothetical protein